MRAWRHPKTFSLISLFYITGVYAPNAQPLRTYADIPFRPFWVDYLTHEITVFNGIGMQIDDLRDRITSQCPIGSAGLQSDSYKNSLGYYIDILRDGQIKFKSALASMKGSTIKGRAQLAKYGFENSQAAKDVYLDLGDIIKDIESLKNEFEEYEDMAFKTTGKRYPVGNTVAQNLLALSLTVNSALVDADNDIVKVPSDGRERFLAKWLDVYRSTASGVKFSRDTYNFLALWMSTDAATEFLNKKAVNPSGESKSKNIVTYRDVILDIWEWFGCWMGPVFNIIDTTTNLMGSVPDLSMPKWSNADSMLIE
ncbi:hypothetical protein TWF694_007256 [Orbilia ellipsospora]|uniref:Uncharacterized protein n=1 Tax=Orbilia ellipsospora TaxID=2528407 RepID=A0AAV9XH70_9PEZI